MSLYDKLPTVDVDKLWNYLNLYSGGSPLPREEMNYFLRYWDTAKQPFYEAFGENFIIKKAVCFDKPCEDMEEEMEDTLRYGSPVAALFRNEFKNRIRTVFPAYTDEYYNMKRFVDDYAMLVKNIYDGPAITIPATFTVNGRPLQVNQNCKASKMLGKIAEALNCAEHYEAFRQAHSQVLNQKQIRGNLCLSIHPLDFLTMSDNASNWGSCMSWMDEPGDYRLGTIEMMNSPYVVIAYVEAKEPMALEYEGDTWNNKRWRQLYVVSPEMILGNRQYPYNSDVLQGTTIKWLRELMTPYKPYGPYAEETCQIENFKHNVFGGNRVYVSLNMDYMYNDIYNQRLAYVAPEYFAKNDRFYLDLSGPAVCTGCGGVIEPKEVDPCDVRCRRCNGYFYCSHCGEWSGGECYTGGDGRLYCEYCYYNELERCECCDDHTSESDMRHIYIQMPGVETFDNWRYYVSICNYCYQHGCYKKDYGEILLVKDEYGIERLAFDLRNIDEDALGIDLDCRTVDLLVAIRNAPPGAEQDALIEKL